MSQAFRGELIKLTTVRSSMWSLAATLLIAAGLSAIVASSFNAAGNTDFDQIFVSFYGISLAQLAIVTFAVLSIGQEHSLGTMRRSLLAMPRRHVFYGAKVLAIIGVAAPVSLATAVASHWIAQTTLGEQGIAFFGDDAARALTGATLYLILICLFAFGVAATLRSTTGALVLLLPIFLLGSQGFGNLPAISQYAQYLPDQAGNMILHMVGPPDAPVFDRAYGPWTGIAILAAWAAASQVTGYLATKRDV